MKKLVSILFTATIFVSVIASASVINVSDLNKKLIRQNASWQARESWLTHLSKTQVKHMMGLRSAPASDIQFEIPSDRRVMADLPAELDWRNKDGKNWISPILNQSNCGSCVAFASVGVLESQYNISSSFAGLNLRLSPQNLFSCGGGTCGWGWYPSAAASYLMRVGVPDEACMPYISGATGQDISCSSSCSGTATRSFKIASFKTPNRSIYSVNSLKQALQHGPVVTTMTVYEDFVGYSSGIYKHTQGSALGGHAVSIVGYNDNERYYVIRNSWGEDWGEKGFVKISYDDTSGIGNQTWSYYVPAIRGAVSMVYPRDYTWVSGQLNVQIQSSYPSTNSMNVSIFDKTNKVVWASNCGASNCVNNLDSASLPDGRYEIQAQAINQFGGDIDISSREFFYVANAKPQLTVSFRGLNVDLNKDLKDRIEFDIRTSSSTVPMNSLEFHYKDSAGIEKTRVAEVVLPSMTMGWRTNFVPNGAYEIWMTGRLKTSKFEVFVESPHQIVNIKN